MVAKKKPTPEEQQLATAQAMRAAYHAERENTDVKDWDELTPEKQARWMAKAVGEDD